MPTWPRRGWTAGSRAATRYQAEFARWNGSKHAFAFMTARAALRACLRALDLRPDAEVIVPGYSCVVVYAAVRSAGCRRVYCDIELETFGLDGARLAALITPRTGAVVLQHLNGYVCRDYELILETAKRHRIKVIEDCAHAAGAEHAGRKVGNRGDMAIYSSQESKVFNTVMGGLAVTNDDELGARLRGQHEQAPELDAGIAREYLRRALLNYHEFKHPQRGQRGEWASRLYGPRQWIPLTDEEVAGRMPPRHQARMSPPMAALGLNQLGKVERYSSLRRRNAERWERWCRERGYRGPTVVPGSRPVCLSYPVLIEEEKKRDLAWVAPELGFVPGKWFAEYMPPPPWPIPGCPRAERALKQCVNLPTLFYD